MVIIQKEEEIIKDRIEKIQTISCPNCKKTGEIGYSFVTNKFDCWDCKHEWLLLYLIVKINSDTQENTSNITSTTFGYVHTRKEAEALVLKLTEETLTMYDPIHEKYFPEFIHQKVCLSDLTTLTA